MGLKLANPSAGKAFKGMFEKLIKSRTFAEQVHNAVGADIRLAEVRHGTFAQTGVIAQKYQDHGTGRNLLPYDNVDLRGYRYGQWIYNNFTSPQASLSNVNTGPINQDVLSLSGGLGVWTDWEAFFLPIEARPFYSYTYSAYSYSAGYNDIEVRVKAAASLVDGINDTDTWVLGTTTTYTEDEEVRPAVSFETDPSVLWLRFEFRSKRGSTSNALFYNFMLERTEQGQNKPSKFTLPPPGRGDEPANVIEGGALKTTRNGMNLEYVSTAQIRVKAGAMYVPGLSRVVSLDTDTLINAPASNWNNWFYVYLSDPDTMPNYAFLSLDPPTQYIGNAKYDTSATFYGYIGAVYVNASGQFRNFQDDGYLVLWNNDRSSRIALSGGSATTNTDFSVANYVPPHCRRLVFDWSLVVGPNNGTVFLTWNGSGLSPQANEGHYALAVTSGNSGRARISGPIPVGSATQLRYAGSASGLDSSVTVVGYYDPR